MYTLTVKRKVPLTGWTEQDYHFVEKNEGLAKIIEVATSEMNTPTDEDLQFHLQPMRGSIPVDVEI